MPPLSGHAAALVTILVWGSTFVVTKVLLVALTPTQILVVRFAAAAGLLIPFTRGFGRWYGRATEVRWAAAGLLGVTAYYLAENGALALSSATNVGVLVSTIPLWTAAASRWRARGERWTGRQALGSAAAVVGIALVMGPGLSVGRGWAGDLLALGAAAAFTAYSLVIRDLPVGTPPLMTVSRSFVWGTLAALPVLAFDGGWPDATVLVTPAVLGPLAFLAVAASALAYLWWNFALRTLGTVTTNAYIYTVPVVNTALGVLVLGEALTPVTAAGCALIVAGVAWGASRTSAGSPPPRRRR